MPNELSPFHPFHRATFRARCAAVCLTALCTTSIACRKQSPPAPAPAANTTPRAGTDAQPTQPSSAARPAQSTQLTDASLTDASIPTVDLIQTLGLELRVSSRVDNKTNKPEHLVDRDLATAWNSKTGDLVGAWFEVDVPADAHVARIEMTAGFTSQTPTADLFVLNPRVRSVRVERDGTEVGTFTLDIHKRELQSLPVSGNGGRLRVTITAVEPGTKSNWREACVSEVRVMGTSAKGAVARHAVPVVQVDQPTTGLDGGTTASVANGEGADAAANVARFRGQIPEDLLQKQLEPGCFAWSETEGAALCVDGMWVGEIEYRNWTVVKLGGKTDFSLELARGSESSREDPFVGEGNPGIWVRDSSALLEELARGKYALITWEPTPIFTSETFSWGTATLRWKRTQDDEGGHGGAPSWSDEFAVRWTPRGSWTRVDEFDSQPVDEPSYKAFIVPGDRYLILSTSRDWADEGIYGPEQRSWLCDRQQQTCGEQSAATTSNASDAGRD